MSVISARPARRRVAYLTGAMVLLASTLVVGLLIGGRSTGSRIEGTLDVWETGQYGCLKQVDSGSTTCGAIVLPDESLPTRFDGKTVEATVERMKSGTQDLNIIWVHTEL